MRKITLDIAHQHHLGIVKTKGLLREKVWWLCIDQDVEHLIKSCHSCRVTSQENNISVPVTPTEMPENCWDTLAIDLQGPYPTGDYLLAIIDYRSRYPCVIQLKHVTTRKNITELDKVFKLFGYPRRLVTGRGQQFRSKEFQQYLRQNDIKLRKTTPYYPWANGEIERCNRCIKKVNQCAHTENEDWRQKLNIFLLLHRTSPHQTTSAAPTTLLFNRHVRNGIPQFLDTKKQKNQTDKVDLNRKAKNKQYIDQKRHAKEIELEKGDVVLEKNMHKENKLSTNWLNKTFKIVKLNDKNALIEDSEGNQYLRNKVHVKKHQSNKNTQQQLVDCQSCKEELPYTLPDTPTPNRVPSISRNMSNEIDFPSAPQEVSRKQYPLSNRSQPKTIVKLQTYRQH